MLREVVNVTELDDPVCSAVYCISSDMELGQNSYFQWYDDWEDPEYWDQEKPCLPEHYKIVADWMKANNKPANTLFLVWW